MTRPDDVFTHALAVLSVPRTGQDVVLKASHAQRERIAADLGIPSITRLDAHFTVIPSRSGIFSVKGIVSADLEQICVVSLEAFQVMVSETVDLRYMEEERLAVPSKKEVERMLDEEDPPEPIVGGSIDLGALAVEFVALALAPFPRKPGIAFAVEAKGEKSENPFAVLASLKKAP
jgi:uncharacterized metal-binding protein YceD (DUF177 family)